MSHKDRLTCSEAAKILGFTADYIRRLCGKGKIKAEKLGKMWIMTEKSIINIAPKRAKKDNKYDGISERSA